jgi:hypothetical protein
MTKRMNIKPICTVYQAEACSSIHDCFREFWEIAENLLPGQSISMRHNSTKYTVKVEMKGEHF